MLEKVFHKPTTPTTSTNLITSKLGKAFWSGEQHLFYLLLFLFPANLAKHFIFPDAYIRGVLVDYLTPTIYLTESLVFLLLAFNIARRLATKTLRMRLVYLFPLILLPSLFSGNFSTPSLFRLFEITLWGGFAFWVAENTVWQKDRRTLIKTLSLGVGWVSLLAVTQFLIQRNVFGYYFFGEPVLYPSLGGVAHVSFFGKEVLRAYGTFPHPNVLGGVLAVFLLWLFYPTRKQSRSVGWMKRGKTKIAAPLTAGEKSRPVWRDGYLLAEGLVIPAVLATLALLVSFSRLAWMAFLFGLLACLSIKVDISWRRKLIFPVSLISLAVAFFIFPSTADLSVVRRLELFQSAKEMFLSFPFVGIGLGLFTAKLSSFGLPSGPTLFLQPAHNVFALVAAESGIFALLAFLLLCISAVRRAWKTKRIFLLISFFQLLFLSLFDHYFYTLPQGLFLTSLTLGLIFSYSKDNGRSDCSWPGTACPR